MTWLETNEGRRWKALNEWLAAHEEVCIHKDPPLDCVDAWIASNPRPSHPERSDAP